MLNKSNRLEIIKDRLFWMSSEEAPVNEQNTIFFNID